MALDKPSNKELLTVVETARSTMYGSLVEVIYNPTSISLLYNVLHS